MLDSPKINISTCLSPVKCILAFLLSKVENHVITSDIALFSITEIIVWQGSMTVIPVTFTPATVTPLDIYPPRHLPPNLPPR